VKEFISSTPLCFDYRAMGPYASKKWLISREREDQPSSYSSNLEYSSDRIEKCKNWGSVTPSFRNFGGQRSNFHIDFLVNRSRYNIDTHGDDITR
jgi:hypothetical protein